MPKQILLLDQARSGSHLLVRMLTSRNPAVQVLDHPCSSARGTQLKWLMSPSYAAGMDAEARVNYDREIEDGLRKWREAIGGLDEDKVLMMHEHIFTTTGPDNMLAIDNAVSSASRKLPELGNFTLMPTSLLLQPDTIPLFSIRDPHDSAPSALRVLAKMSLPMGAGRPNFLIVTNLIYTRLLYSWFEQQGLQPVVVDLASHADPEFLPALCRRLGLDPGLAVSTWAPVSDRERKEMHPSYYTSQSSLVESSGFVAENIGCEDEAKWEGEFGVEGAELIREMVELSRPHYEWLFERRFRD